MLADIFGVDDSLIMDRGRRSLINIQLLMIISAYNLMHVVFRCFDMDADNYISYEEYIKGMSVFLKGKYEEKLKCTLID